MTVIDSSALVAILSGEPEAASLVSAVAGSPRRLLSAATLVETSIVIDARFGDIAARELDLFLHRAGVQTIAVDGEQVAIARAAGRLMEKVAIRPDSTTVTSSPTPWPRPPMTASSTPEMTLPGLMWRRRDKRFGEAFYLLRSVLGNSFAGAGPDRVQPAARSPRRSFQPRRRPSPMGCGAFPQEASQWSDVAFVVGRRWPPGFVRFRMR